MHTQTNAPAVEHCAHVELRSTPSDKPLAWRVHPRRTLAGRGHRARTPDSKKPLDGAVTTWRRSAQTSVSTAPVPLRRGSVAASHALYNTQDIDPAGTAPAPSRIVDFARIAILAYGVAMLSGARTDPAMGTPIIHSAAHAKSALIARIHWLAAGAVLFLNACASTDQEHNHKADAPWLLQRRVATATAPPACTLISAPTAFSTGAGLDHVRIRIHSDGLLSLQSDHDPFDITVRDQMGVQVKGQAPVLAPRLGSSPREMTFSPADSAKLLEQFAEGKWARIQVALVPRKEMLTAAYSLKGFEEALRSYRMCEVFRAKQEGETPPFRSTQSRDEVTD